MNRHALKLARELRRAGISADLGDESFRLKKSFELAEKAGAKYIVIVGENEVAADQFTVKNLAAGEQMQVQRANSHNSCENRISFQQSAVSIQPELQCLNTSG